MRALNRFDESNEVLARCPVRARVSMWDPVFRIFRRLPCVIVRESRCFFWVQSSSASAPFFELGAVRRLPRHKVEVSDAGC